VDIYVVEGTCRCDPGVFGDSEVKYLSDRRGRHLGGLTTMLMAGWRLGVSLRRQRYDVVHAALARAYVLAPLVAPWRERPQIVVWRRNLGTHLNRWGFAAALEAVTARFCDVIVANSAAVKDYLLERRLVPPERIRVIPNGLEAWRFETVTPVSGNPAVPRLVTVGRLEGIKGHHMLLDAASTLRRTSPIEVVILGEGPGRSALEAHAALAGVSLVAPGHICDTRPWLGSATLYVHASYSEGASNALGEAMAQGCSIIATDVGGAAEMLGQFGVLVPPGDAAAMAAAIQALLDDPDRRAALGEGARERAREVFSMDRVVERHLAVYAGG
jgi:glycosyltransferase involved in cell wall biosynthesis